MQSRNHLIIFISIFVLVGFVWAGLFFFTDRNVGEEKAPYGVVQTIHTKPSSAELVGSYYDSLMSLVEGITLASNCDEVVQKVDAQLGSLRVPKEFLDIHLEAFLLVKQQMREHTETCVGDIEYAVGSIADTVTSTML